MGVFQYYKKPYCRKTIKLIKKSEGRFSYFGFSFHDDHDAFIKILDGYDAWDFCQVQHNYMDIEHQQGQAGVNEAAARGLGVVAMEPIRGGNL